MCNIFCHGRKWNKWIFKVKIFYVSCSVQLAWILRSRLFTEWSNSHFKNSLIVSMWALKPFHSLGVRNHFVTIYYILITNGSKVWIFLIRITSLAGDSRGTVSMYLTPNTCTDHVRLKKSMNQRYWESILNIYSISIWRWKSKEILHSKSPPWFQRSVDTRGKHDY